MPFWWRRRRKPWFGRWRYKAKRRRWTTRRKSTRRRRRPRRFVRRRRRYGRKRKVRRKKKRLILTQWQPDSIVKCKIKLLDTFIIGAQGTQFKCYTNEASKYYPPKQPGGGGFGSEVFTLQDLYYRYRAHKCIWTKTNDYKDLCRYLGCTFIFYRHPTTDFIINYTLQPPFTLDKFSYTQIHPVNMLLQRKKKILYSLKSKPWGKSIVKLKIKPPKQMISKWFFQNHFATAGLVQIQAVAADFGFSTIGNTWSSNNLSIYFLNVMYYQDSHWGFRQNSPYKPFYTLDTSLKYWYKNKGKTEYFIVSADTYDHSINYDKGFFCWKLLNAYSITSSNSTKDSDPQAQAHKPIAVGRYNPQLDTGTGNEVWLVSTLSESYNKPTHSPELIFTGYPLWMIFHGYYNYLLKIHKDATFLDSYFFVVRSPAILKLTTTTTQDYYPLIDQSFLNGNMPYNEYLDENSKNKWYPTIKKQLEIINNIVCCGPFIPKYSDNRESTWELKYKSTFFFKWGGPQITDQPVTDPQKQKDYDVPDKFKETLQISDPITQSCKQMFHDWDYRRGAITSTAFKRMYENLETYSAISTDASEPPQKIQRITAEIPYLPEKTEKIQECLLSLCEEDTCQEQDLNKLIQHQQQQQHKLKKHILHLIADLKNKQRMLQLQTGIID
nr:MAG: ORF1 [Torque teno midi virus]